MQTVSSSEMTVNFHPTTCGYIRRHYSSQTPPWKPQIPRQNYSLGCSEKNQGQQFLKPITIANISRLYSSPSLTTGLISVWHLCYMTFIFRKFSDRLLGIVMTFPMKLVSRNFDTFFHSRDSRVMNGAVSYTYDLKFPLRFIFRGRQPLLEITSLTKGG